MTLTTILAPRPPLAARAAALVLATFALASGAMPANAIEPVQRIVSPGGIEALLIESHEVGVISMRFSFRGGALEDPADKPGVAHLASYLFNEGAGDLDTQSLMRRMSRIGADFSGETNAENLTVTLSTPSAHRDEAFGLLKLAVAAPRFDAEPLERGKRAALATLEQERQDPGSAAWRQLGTMLYGKSRYAISEKGTPEGLALISAEDIRAYRSRVFARDNIRVAVAGDIDASTLSKVLDDVFGALPAKADIRPAQIFMPAQAQKKTIALDLPQTIVVFANFASALDARQSLGASLFNQILSAQFTGRLFMALREREGLVYSISTDRGLFSRFGSFYGSFGAAPGNAERAMSLAMSEINRLVSEGPSEQELEDAKGAFRGGYYLGLDTSANLSSTLLAMLEQKLPDTYLADFDSAIASITIDEVKAAAKLVARPDAMAIVSVGKVQQTEVLSPIP
jgi:zinc protease